MRRALLISASTGAVCAGVWQAWQHLTHPTPATHPSDLIVGDQLTAAFWQQHFNTPTGTPLAWSDLKGHPIVLNFWATWCPPCVREMPELDRFQREFAPKNWKVVGLAVDEAEPVRKFLTKVGVGFDIGVAGFDGTRLAQALGNTTAGLPFTVLIDAQSRVRHRLTGATDLAQLAKQARRIHPG
ncbi:MAG: TlpA family protein disulfide reductase [Aquabacterium sp.]|jgi:thiol-disulfide isomerase/thioredoxin|uniref:TlpA family protein disulfide reductase n=1 Tax=Aquabacterium sp. TaxID=1872578 RepID=UPI001B65D90A|nr:TlpA disulfide reductase family protein [Aquabacterium sp.]MBP7131386.1 TlpA family protein disulfide reductase [Aquabacterium sp.]MBP9063808.1 TlpA family protein disulfide reductase [Aquabacterium sp.]MDQ5925827.1 hypothetical protein [Pseudomonadota bacterium]